jgi:hypothetical protein
VVLNYHAHLAAAPEQTVSGGCAPDQGALGKGGAAMSDVTGTDIDDEVAQITQAERVVADPSMKGSIAYYGSMLLLAKLGRTAWSSPYQATGAQNRVGPPHDVARSPRSLDLESELTCLSGVVHSRRALFGLRNLPLLEE